jgi:hypothetical protein
MGIWQSRNFDFEKIMTERVRKLTPILAYNYITYRLQKGGFVCFDYLMRSYPEIKINQLAIQLEDEYKRTFKVGIDFQLTVSNAYEKYLDGCNEIFKNGVTYGKVIAFFAYSGLFALQYAKITNAYESRDRICVFMEMHIEKYLTAFLVSKGGWHVFS